MGAMACWACWALCVCGCHPFHALSPAFKQLTLSSLATTYSLVDSGLKMSLHLARQQGKAGQGCSPPACHMCGKCRNANERDKDRHSRAECEEALVKQP